MELVGGKAVVLASAADGPCVRTRGDGAARGGPDPGRRGRAGRRVRADLARVGRPERTARPGDRGRRPWPSSSPRARRSRPRSLVSRACGCSRGPRAELREVRIPAAPSSARCDATRPAALLLRARPDPGRGHRRLALRRRGVARVRSRSAVGAGRALRGRGHAPAPGGADRPATSTDCSPAATPASTAGACARPAAGARGLALVRSQAVLEEVHVESAGQLAGVQLVSSEVRIHGSSRSRAVAPRGSSPATAGSRSRRRPSSGPVATDVHRRRCHPDPRRPRHAGPVSACRTAAASGSSPPRAPAVTLSRSSIRGAGVAGVSVETEASLTATEISIEGTPGPAVLVDRPGHGAAPRGDRPRQPGRRGVGRVQPGRAGGASTDGPGTSPPSPVALHADAALRRQPPGADLPGRRLRDGRGPVRRSIAGFAGTPPAAHARRRGGLRGRSRACRRSPARRASPSCPRSRAAPPGRGPPVAWRARPGSRPSPAPACVTPREPRAVVDAPVAAAERVVAAPVVELTQQPVAHRGDEVAVHLAEHLAGRWPSG